MKKMKGFTLVELVIVILILGILAAYAAPKFLGMDREARKAVVNSLRATVSSTSEMIHAMAITQGVNGEQSGKVVDNGMDIEVNMGYAVANTANFDKLITLDTAQFKAVECKDNSCSWKAKVRNPELCKVVYAWDAKTKEPKISAEIKNCGNTVDADEVNKEPNVPNAEDKSNDEEKHSDL